MINQDITANDLYICTPGPALQCPIAFYAGIDENDVTDRDILHLIYPSRFIFLFSVDAVEWKAQTKSDKFLHHRFPGGHFYLQDLKVFFETFTADLKKFL